jgi:hypothetical protein
MKNLSRELVAVLVGLSVTLASTQAAGQHGSGMLHELHQAAKLLEKVDHDYDGHRKAALAEVHKAIKGMQHHGQHQHGGQHLTSAGGQQSGGKGQTGQHRRHQHEKQGNSDAQMKEARTLLENVEKHLHQGRHGHGHMGKEIRHAIHQIDQGLKAR